jgi:hypothetical protein
LWYRKSAVKPILIFLLVRLGSGPSLPIKHQSSFTELATWSRALPEKLVLAQLVKQFPAFYGIRRFITVFTKALFWSLSWGRWIQSTKYFFKIL